MKKLLFILVLSISSSFLFAQDSSPIAPKSVSYFGGIYEGKVYFNWTAQNTDTCMFIIFMSEDGKEYREFFCLEVPPVPVKVMHSFQLPTSSKEVWVKVSAEVAGKKIEFTPTSFVFERYTNVVVVYPYKVVHASF
jgi:hypothetical protein